MAAIHKQGNACLLSYLALNYNLRVTPTLLSDCPCQVDCWAVGVLVYELLTGNPPFHKKEREDTTLSILSREPEFEAWGMSPKSRFFIQAALSKVRRDQLTLRAHRRLEVLVWGPHIPSFHPSSSCYALHLAGRFLSPQCPAYDAPPLDHVVDGQGGR